MYRLDKKFSKTSTLNEASSSYGYWKTKTMEERIEAAVYLIKTSYRIIEFPKMEKTLFSIRKLSD